MSICLTFYMPYILYVLSTFYIYCLHFICIVYICSKFSSQGLQSPVFEKEIEAQKFRDLSQVTQVRSKAVFKHNQNHLQCQPSLLHKVSFSSQELVGWLRELDGNSLDWGGGWRGREFSRMFSNITRHLIEFLALHESQTLFYATGPPFFQALC